MRWEPEHIARLQNFPLPEAHLLGVASCRVLQRVRPWPRVPRGRPERRVGVLLGFAGAGLVVGSWAAAGRVDLTRPDRVVASGPYAVVRHPMYVGWTLVHLGVGLASGSRWVVLTVPVAVAWVHREVRREECALDRSLGAQFREYRSRVPRYVPRLRRRW